MNIVTLLEMKEGNPRQYRLTVLQDDAVNLLRFRVAQELDGVTTVGWYPTSAEALRVLQSYLDMEQSK